MFEDLPNELIYEIFEFLDGCHAYTSFADLNIRFRQLFVQSSLPLKLQFRLTSQAILQYHYKHIVVPNRNRIVSLSLLHPVIVNYFLTSVPICPLFAQLEALVIDNIKSNHLLLLLEQLTLLPRLFSFSVYVNDNISEDYDKIYDAIFALPLLKYCKVLLASHGYFWKTSKPVHHVTNIECLTITVPKSWQEIYALISCAPRLRHLVSDFSEQFFMGTSDLQKGLCHLTHLSLKTHFISFASIEPFIISCSIHLEVLRIKAKRRDYLNADRWQQLIICHIPNLVIFHLHVGLHINVENDNTFHPLIDKFNSLFWFTHKWFFDHCHRISKSGSEWIFHSIKPNR